MAITTITYGNLYENGYEDAFENGYEDALRSIMNFVGNFRDKLPSSAEVGDIAYCTSDCHAYMYTSNGWEWIYAGAESTEQDYPSNCVNCGAVLHSHICEYCGSDNGGKK